VKKRLALALIPFILVVSACAGSGAPSDYDEAVRTNFIEACTTQGEASNDPAELPAICECSYEGLINTVPYPTFKEFDDSLRDDPNTAFPEAISSIFANCLRDSL